MLAAMRKSVPTMSIEAIYERGQLRPVQPLALPEGARVRITVETPQPAAAAEEPWDHERAVREMEEVAALPIEGQTDPFAGRDHDHVLYGARPRA